MSKKATYILGLFLTIVFGTFLFYNLCCATLDEDETLEEVTEVIEDKEVVKPATKTEFSMVDNKSGVSFHSLANFSFRFSNAMLIKPVPEALKREVDRLATFLNDNPLKTAEITGYYRDDEVNTSAFPDLGLARANAVKSYLMTEGVSSQSINTYGELNEAIEPDEGAVFFGPLAYYIGTLKDNDTRLKEEITQLNREIRTDPLVLYFDIGNTAINLTEAQREKVAKISRVLDKSNNVKLQIIGHTDNTGDRQSNIDLALKRAGFIKEYFVDNAISEAKIETSSKGPDAPIASNDTEAGRSKNRRVVVTIN